MRFLMCRAWDAESKAIIGVFAAIAAVKLFLLAAFGPISTPDTSGYIEYAEQILRSSAWLHDAGLSSSAMPITAVRMAGFPALIAAAMTVSGPHWPYLVIALQFILSFAAAWALYRLAQELALPWQIAIAAVATFMLSFQLTLDQSLLTDSIDASCLVIATCLVADGAAGHRPLRFGAAAFAGLLLAIAFLFREALQFLVILLLPLLAVGLWSAGRDRWMHSAFACGLVLLPLAATVQLYKSWNEHRTGERFVTTVASFNFPQAVVLAAKRDAAVVAGDTPIDRAARQQITSASGAWDEVVAINEALFNDGFKATDIDRMAHLQYVSAWREHPLAMLTSLQHHTSERAAKLTIRPVAAVCETIEWAGAAHRCYDYRDLYRRLPFFQGLPWAAPAFFVLQTTESTLAIGLFSAFLIGVPCLAVSRLLSSQGRLEPAVLTIGSFWLLYVGWFVAYASVHYEDRHMLPVIPFSILGGFYICLELFLQRRASVKAAVLTP
jgi:hypothetical protein